jgi:uncharacterized protein (DUF488 family)
MNIIPFPTFFFRGEGHGYVNNMAADITIFTIGHSTRPIEEFISILKAFDIKLVADVRTIPKSRFNPQFNSDDLTKSLKNNRIDYVHMAGLGGLRHPRKDSLNAAWKNMSFRGFADYMQTEDFKKSLAMLVNTAEKQQTAVMCAEAVPWRCHRSLIGDALLVHGIKVVNIMSKSTLKDHTLTPWAKVNETRITYPAE